MYITNLYQFIMLHIPTSCSFPLKTSFRYLDHLIGRSDISSSRYLMNREVMLGKELLYIVGWPQVYNNEQESMSTDK